jgi:hypothetical protein
VNAAQRRRTARARELAAIHALREAADAARASIAAASHCIVPRPDPVALLAAQVSDLLLRLDRVALEYCDYIAALPQLGLPSDRRVATLTSDQPAAGAHQRAPAAYFRPSEFSPLRPSILATPLTSALEQPVISAAAAIIVLPVKLRAHVSLVI